MPLRRRTAPDEARALAASHPRSVPIVAMEIANGTDPDRPFEEGAHDAIDAELRLRMISEAAYAAVEVASGGRFGRRGEQSQGIGDQRNASAMDIEARAHLAGPTSAAATNSTRRAAEFALIVRSDIKRRGLGPILLKKLIDYCRNRGTRELVGQALAGNQRIIGLALV